MVSPQLRFDSPRSSGEVGELRERPVDRPLLRFEEFEPS